MLSHFYWVSYLYQYFFLLQAFKYHECRTGWMELWIKDGCLVCFSHKPFPLAVCIDRNFQTQQFISTPNVFLIVYFPINFETVRSLGPVFRFTTWMLSKLKIPPMSNSNTKTYRIQPQKCVSFPFVFQLSKQNFFMHRYGTYTFSSRFQECCHNFVTTFQVFTLGFRNFIMKFLWTWKRKTPNLAFWLQFQRDKLLLFCAKTLLE